MPQFAWSDLAQALVTTAGRLTATPARRRPGPHESPYGVEKQSYTDALFADGRPPRSTPGPNDPTADLPGWFTAHQRRRAVRHAGDPWSSRRCTSSRTYRSAYYLPVPPPAAQVPVFAAQGVTDPLFPGIQLLQMVNKLTAAYPGYPVWSALGDLGHAYAANPHALWVSVNDEANAFLSAVLAGQQPQLPRFSVTTVGCLPGQQVTTYSAASFAALATGLLRLRSTGPATVVNVPVSGARARGGGDRPDRQRRAARHHRRLPGDEHDHRPRGGRVDLVAADPGHPGRRPRCPGHCRRSTAPTPSSPPGCGTSIRPPGSRP